jgi:hypothetical protein
VFGNDGTVNLGSKIFLQRRELLKEFRAVHTKAWLGSLILLFVSTYLVTFPVTL